jgi:hypothetical protein
LAEAIIQQDKWDDGPGQVEANVINPVVEELGATIRGTGEACFCPVGRIVQGYAVEMSYADNNLEKVAMVGLSEDAKHSKDGERAPGELDRLAIGPIIEASIRISHHSDGFHTNCKDIRRQISGIR